jgi:hypothetical protein
MFIDMLNHHEFERFDLTSLYTGVMDFSLWIDLPGSQTIYHSQCEHANYYTKDAVQMK